MDGLSLFKILNYYKDFILNAKVNWCSYDDFGFTISLYNESKKKLVFDSHLKNFIVFTDAGEKRKNILVHLSGSKIVEVKQRGFDRVFYLKCLKRKPSGKLMEYRLVFETVGRLSNVFLLERDRIIFKWNENNIDNDRKISLGDKYIPFKNNKNKSLYDADCSDFENLEGFYNVTALHAKNLLDNVEDCDQVINKILNSLMNDPYFYLDEKNRLVPFEIINFTQKIVIDELEKFLKAKSSNKVSDDSYYLRLKKIFEKKVQKNEQLLKKLKEDLKKAKRYKEYLEEASLLKDNLYIFKNNYSKRVILSKYDVDGVKAVEYEVTFNEPVEKYIEKLFKKGNKLKRSIDIIQERIEEVQALISYYKDELFNLENLDEEEIKDLYMEYSAKKISSKKTVKQKPYFKIRKEDLTLYVGKNSRGNQYIVFKVAKPDDLWFHAHNIPSAHVIMKKDGKIKDEDIIFAAKITAHFSKYKNEKKVPIDYTLRKYVKKPKNTPDGFVIYKNYKTVIVAPAADEEIENLKE